ncbi:MAG: hypothetical protein A2Y61_05580 [Chloroflexi bacterium RBG_13_60_13]|nr:MAG: hypothetical protein A2Y61_05580 [Chloroflexi bacterium RBG_13_60_13]
MRIIAFVQHNGHFGLILTNQPPSNPPAQILQDVLGPGDLRRDAIAYTINDPNLHEWPLTIPTDTLLQPVWT